MSQLSYSPMTQRYFDRQTYRQRLAGLSPRFRPAATENKRSEDCNGVFSVIDTSQKTKDSTSYARTNNLNDDLQCSKHRLT